MWVITLACGWWGGSALSAIWMVCVHWNFHKDSNLTAHYVVYAKDRAAIQMVGPRAPRSPPPPLPFTHLDPGSRSLEPIGPSLDPQIPCLSTQNLGMGELAISYSTLHTRTWTTFFVVWATKCGCESRPYVGWCLHQVSKENLHDSNTNSSITCDHFHPPFPLTIWYNNRVLNDFLTKRFVHLSEVVKQSTLEWRNDLCLKNAYDVYTS